MPSFLSLRVFWNKYDVLICSNPTFLLWSSLRRVLNSCCWGSKLYLHSSGAWNEGVRMLFGHLWHHAEGLIFWNAHVWWLGVSITILITLSGVDASEWGLLCCENLSTLLSKYKTAPESCAVVHAQDPSEQSIPSHCWAQAQAKQERVSVVSSQQWSSAKDHRCGF